MTSAEEDDDTTPQSPDKPKQTRDALGRWLPGVAGNNDPHPYAKSIINLKRAFLSCISPDMMRRITTHLLHLCQDKDSKVAIEAQTLFFNRVFGKPTEAVTLSVQGNSESDAAPLRALSDQQLARMLAIAEEPIPIEVESVRLLESSVR